MKLYYYPSSNPQKIQFALFELGLDCEIVPVNLGKREQKTPEFLALNPCGRVPVLTDGALTLWESNAILAYLGDKTGKLWPATAAGRGDALRWLFYLTAHLAAPAGDYSFNRLAPKLFGISGDQEAIARSEKALPDVITILEGQLAVHQWMLGGDFTLVDCAYGPVLNTLVKAGFALDRFPAVHAYLEAIRTRPAWIKTPRQPGLD